MADGGGSAPHANGKRKQIFITLKAKVKVRLFLALFVIPLLYAEQPLPPAEQPIPLPEPVIVDDDAFDKFLFDRPLRQRSPSVPERITRQRHDRLRFPVVPTIHGIDEPLTESYIKRYSKTAGLNWISSVMKKAEPYLAFVRNEIERRGLPPELLYLPVIESGYTSAALSSSGAAGLWQFMQNSIKPYMVINEYMDERRDFWKSTHGALSKLEENYGNYRDWALALAAYNAGGGAVNRLIKQTGISDYWILSARGHLKTESVHYVPKLIAVYHIVSNPRKFGLDISWKPAETEWARLPLSRQADLRLLAEHAGIDKNELLSMNSELYHHVTPPAGYMLKVKKEHVETVRNVVDNHDIKLVNSYYYRIKSGDTLSDLSRHYGVSVNQILAQNPDISPNSLQIGRTISIPALKDTAPYTGKPREVAGLSDADVSMTGVWVVKKGDTLWSIARSCGVSTEALAKANSISLSAVLRIGSHLKVPEL
ncbi:MAG: LysM peptidoglycan-binding domain-containing protein [Spirochaetaceae bacterium]|nr:LysM peptidoglycan-binding domain-containing protein [Spirochaetaceae bacterium]